MEDVKFEVMGDAETIVEVAQLGVEGYLEFDGIGNTQTFALATAARCSGVDSPPPNVVGRISTQGHEVEGINYNDTLKK